FQMRPDNNYESMVFGEFNSWLRSNHRNLAAAGRQINVIVSAELETSNRKYPSGWIELVRRYRAWLKAEKLSKVKIGINPNWYPMYEEPLRDPEKCSQYNALLKQADFMAVSFYGNWAGRQFPEVKSVETRKNEVLSRMSRLDEQNCRVDAVYEVPFVIGEFGVGGLFRATEAQVEYADLAKQTHLTLEQRKQLLSDPEIEFESKGLNHPIYRERRRNLYKSLISWAKSASAEEPYFISLWTVGFFDPVGIRKDDPSVRADPAIAEMLNEYSEWRCSQRTPTSIGALKKVKSNGKKSSPRKRMRKPTIKSNRLIDARVVSSEEHELPTLPHGLRALQLSYTSVH
ncbi:MAG: hypothetical protein AB1540_16615, partial [Bdellovibrionota bacterium]